MNEYLLNSNKIKPMNTLRQNLWDRFFKKEESVIADLVESVEEKLQPVQELIAKLSKIEDSSLYHIKQIEYAVEDKAKNRIKQEKQILQNLQSDIDDELVQQLLAISSKIVTKDKE